MSVLLLPSFIYSTSIPVSLRSNDPSYIEREGIQRSLGCVGYAVVQRRMHAAENLLRPLEAGSSIKMAKGGGGGGCPTEPATEFNTSYNIGPSRRRRLMSRVIVSVCPVCRS